jgi:DNA-binding transcriptional LysR family regulator
MLYFTAVADEMNFSSAAEELYLSQSSLSKRIKSLEKQLGVELFTRSSHTIGLTPAGKALLPYARSISIELETLHEITQKFVSPNKRLRIASISLLTTYAIDGLLSEFIMANPDINVSLSEISSDRALVLLHGTCVDACIVYAEQNSLDEGDHSLTLTPERLVAAMNPHNPLSQKKTISLRELRGIKIAMTSERDEPFVLHYFYKYCRKAGVDLQIEKMGVWIYTLESILSNETAVSIVPQTVAEHYHLSFTPIRDIPAFSLSLVTGRNYHLPILQEFAKALQIHFAQIHHDPPIA